MIIQEVRERAGNTPELPTLRAKSEIDRERSKSNKRKSIESANEKGKFFFVTVPTKLKVDTNQWIGYLLLRICPSILPLYEPLLTPSEQPSTCHLLPLAGLQLLHRMNFENRPKFRLYLLSFDAV